MSYPKLDIRDILGPNKVEEGEFRNCSARIGSPWLFLICFNIKIFSK